MKPLLKLRALLTVAAAVVALFILEKSRRKHLHNLHVHNSKAATAMPGSANDFILFESLSKYLFVSFSN